MCTQALHTLNTFRNNGPVIIPPGPIVIPPPAAPGPLRCGGFSLDPHGRELLSTCMHMHAFTEQQLYNSTQGKLSAAHARTLCCTQGNAARTRCLYMTQTHAAPLTPPHPTLDTQRTAPSSTLPGPGPRLLATHHTAHTRPRPRPRLAAGGAQVPAALAGRRRGPWRTPHTAAASHPCQPPAAAATPRQPGWTAGPSGQRTWRRWGCGCWWGGQGSKPSRWRGRA